MRGDPANQAGGGEGVLRVRVHKTQKTKIEDVLNEVEYQLLVLECNNVIISVDKNQAVIEGYKKEDPAHK